MTSKNDQQIDRQTSNRNSLITVRNWERYQTVDQQDDQQLTNSRPTSDQQATTNKNIENIENLKNIRNTVLCDFDERADPDGQLEYHRDTEDG